MWLPGRRASWPTVSREEILKRARILVIDDQDFPYITLFKRDGYAIEQWDDVDDLPALEQNSYDIILLDLRGVGRDHSKDEGLGILKHLRKVSPAQIVVAYSSSDLSLAYQPFFRDADMVLHKTQDDYVTYKRAVDELLDRRFSLGFYLDRVGTELGEYVQQAPKARKKARRALVSGDKAPLLKYLRLRIDDDVIVDRVIAVVTAGAQIAALWKS
jgi:hypothetical protein